MTPSFKWPITVISTHTLVRSVKTAGFKPFTKKLKSEKKKKRLKVEELFKQCQNHFHGNIIAVCTAVYLAGDSRVR